MVDSNGCSNTCTHDVTINALPICTITADPSACSDATGLSASAPSGMASYSWSIANGEIVGTTDTQSITFNAGTSGITTLTVTVVDSNGCSNTCYATVSILAYNPDIQIDKSASVSSAKPGQTITYSYDVTNTGDIELSDVKVTDDNLDVKEMEAEPNSIDSGGDEQ